MDKTGRYVLNIKYPGSSVSFLACNDVQISFVSKAGLIVKHVIVNSRSSRSSYIIPPFEKIPISNESKRQSKTSNIIQSITITPTYMQRR